MGQPGEACAALCSLWPVPVAPVLGKCSLPTAALALFAFFGGLRLFCLVVAASRERESLRTEKQYRDDMQTYMSVVRSQRHDYNFHVQTLHGLLLRKDYEACEKYLEELLQDSVAMNRLLPLKDAAVSALILSFQSRAQQEGIRLEITVENDLSQIATNVYETNKIIGNLLQNALDETERLTDRSFGIHLTILKRGEFCIINVANEARQGIPWPPTGQAPPPRAGTRHRHRLYPGPGGQVRGRGVLPHGGPGHPFRGKDPA